MGFQDLPEIVHIAASRKGGKIRKTKGLGSLSPERRREIASMGGRAKHENRSRQGSIKKEASTHKSEASILAEIYTDIISTNEARTPVYPRLEGAQDKERNNVQE